MLMRVTVCREVDRDGNAAFPRNARGDGTIICAARGSINARGHIHLATRGANRINLRIYPRREVSSHSMKVKLSPVHRAASESC